MLTIENSRSGDEMLRALAKYGYSRDIGAGVYDVHSPVVPPVDFIEKKIKTFLDVGLLGGNKNLLWVNPDCGLKTREWSQVRNSAQVQTSPAVLPRVADGLLVLTRQICCKAAHHGIRKWPQIALQCCFLQCDCTSKA